MLGKAARVVATKDATTIVGGKGKKADIAARIATVEGASWTTPNQSSIKKNLKSASRNSRAASRSSRVGAATETEMKYLKDKIDDAVKATKASIEEGIVAGGGTALAKVAKKLAQHQDSFGAGRAAHDIR